MPINLSKMFLLTMEIFGITVFLNYTFASIAVKFYS